MKKSICNIFYVLLFVIVAFGAIQIVSVTTFRYEVIRGDGHVTRVGPSIEIDMAKLIRKFYSKPTVDHFQKSCDDNPFSTSGCWWNHPIVLYEKRQDSKFWEEIHIHVDGSAYKVNQKEVPMQ